MNLNSRLPLLSSPLQSSLYLDVCLQSIVHFHRGNHLQQPLRQIFASGAATFIVGCCGVRVYYCHHGVEKSPDVGVRISGFDRITDIMKLSQLCRH